MDEPSPVSTNATKQTMFSSKEGLKILPTDFVNYLPWACLQLQFSFLVNVHKIIQGK